ncbi:MAG: hypothetical protein KCHDKBKB_00204 [Elusimicrobia bacterium]|nr:hypothetical protein [Elusimicrobiota bacterium]
MTSKPKVKKPSENTSEVWSPKIQQSIKQIIKDMSPPKKDFENADVVQEIIVTALKGVEAQIGRGDLKLLSRAIRELRYAFKIFQNYRHVRKVTIFGSARTPSNEISYQMTKSFAKKLINNGYMIITGAGPGIMQAGNEGAGPKGSFGVNIKLPFEQHPNPFIADQPTYIDCRYFFTRKLVFVKEAAGAAFFPGGFGTLDEAFEILTLVQTGKCEPIPIVLIDAPGKHFWKDLNGFITKQMLKEKKISPEDQHLYKITDSVEEAASEIFRFYSNYHSMRYVKDKLVLRLKRPIDKSQLRTLNSQFKDILTEGSFEKSDPLSEESNQPDLNELPRLVFSFNRMNNGRLRQLIDFMNMSQ